MGGEVSGGTGFESGKPGSAVAGSSPGDVLSEITKGLKSEDPADKAKAISKLVENYQQLWGYNTPGEFQEKGTGRKQATKGPWESRSVQNRHSKV